MGRQHRQLGKLKVLAKKRTWVKLGGLKRSLGGDGKSNTERKKRLSKRWVRGHVLHCRSRAGTRSQCEDWMRGGITGKPGPASRGLSLKTLPLF